MNEAKTQVEKAKHIKHILWIILACFVSVVAVTISGIFYTNHVQRDTNRQWCELLRPLDKAYSETPPATELGRDVANALHSLYIKFNC